MVGQSREVLLLLEVLEGVRKHGVICYLKVWRMIGYQPVQLQNLTYEIELLSPFPLFAHFSKAEKYLKNKLCEFQQYNFIHEGTSKLR